MTVALIVLVLACVADVVSTFIAVGNSRLEEKTPFVAWAIDRFGAGPGLILTKVTTVGPLALIALCWPSRPLTLVVSIVALMTGVIAANNIRLIIKHR